MKSFLIALLVGVLLATLAAQQPLDVQVPSGTMVYFDRTTAMGCPAGWTEYTAARGLFVFGLTNGGTKATVVGTPLTNQEDRTHTHTFPHTHTMAHTHTIAGTTGADGSRVAAENGAAGVSVGNVHAHSFSGTSAGSSAANTGSESTANTGTPSVTIAPYLQELLCQKS